MYLEMGSCCLAKVSSMIITWRCLALSKRPPSSRSVLLPSGRVSRLLIEIRTLLIPRREVLIQMPGFTSPIQLIRRGIQLLARLEVPSYPTCPLPNESYHIPLLAHPKFALPKKSPPHSAYSRFHDVPTITVTSQSKRKLPIQ